MEQEWNPRTPAPNPEELGRVWDAVVAGEADRIAASTVWVFQGESSWAVGGVFGSRDDAEAVVGRYGLEGSIREVRRDAVPEGWAWSRGLMASVDVDQGTPWVWVFQADAVDRQVEVFSSEAGGRRFIAENGLTGVLTAYPLGRLPYEWALEAGVFEPPRRREIDASFIGGYVDGRQWHGHFVGGLPSELADDDDQAALRSSLPDRYPLGEGEWTTIPGASLGDLTAALSRLPAKWGPYVFVRVTRDACAETFGGGGGSGLRRVGLAELTETPAGTADGVELFVVSTVLAPEPVDLATGDASIRLTQDGAIRVGVAGDTSGSEVWLGFVGPVGSTGGGVDHHLGYRSVYQHLVNGLQPGDGRGRDER